MSTPRLDLTVDHLHACGVSAARPRLLELLQLSHPRLCRYAFDLPRLRMCFRHLLQLIGGIFDPLAERWSTTSFVETVSFTSVNIASKYVTWPSNFSSTSSTEGSHMSRGVVVPRVVDLTGLHTRRNQVAAF